jgi:hypothetical protein
MEEEFYQFALLHFTAVKRAVLATRPQEKSYYVYDKVRQIRSGPVISRN